MNETDPLSNLEKAKLLTWREAFYKTAQVLQDFPYEPSFGHYPHTLELRTPEDFTDPNDPAGRPDDTYYQAQGVEPPQEAHKPFRAALLALWHNREFCLFLGALAVFLVVMAFYPVN